MDRSLNIPATDEAVFRLVQETHKQSSLLREEVKRRVLEAQDQRLGRSVEQEKAVQARIKRIEKDLYHAQEVLGTIEGSFDLGDLPKKAFEAKRRVVKAKIEQFELALNNAQLELRGSQATQRWVEWYKTYGDEVASKAHLTAEQKKEYIEGLVQRIEVRYDRDSNEHELTVQFRMPIVGDSIRYKDRRKKNLGYDLLSGNSIATVKVRKGASKSPLPLTP